MRDAGVAPVGLLQRGPGGALATRGAATAGFVLLCCLAALALLSNPAAAQDPAQFVATGIGGTIAYSVDGTTWTPAIYPASTQPIWAVAHNGTHWLAAAAGVVWISDDGITWASYPTPMSATTWGGVTWGDDRWIVAGGSSQVITSTDGVNWSPVTYPTAVGNILGTTHSNGEWVNSGNFGIAYSADGLTWTYAGNGGLGTTPNARAQVNYGGTWYVAAATGGGVAASTNGGATWTLVANVGAITKMVANDADTVVAVGNGGNRLWVTADMTTWTAPPNPFTGLLYGLTYSNGLFVAAGYSGNIATSPDGTTWTMHTWPWGGSNIYAVAGLSGPVLRARPEQFTFNEDQASHAFDVLGNDLQGMGGAFSIVANSMPTKGSLSGPVAGAFTYQPYPDASGADSFTYTIRDELGRQSMTTVSLTINPVNDRPSFLGDPTPVLTMLGQGTRILPGWGTALRPGPATATDETTQGLVFILDSNNAAGLFLGPPAVLRAGGPLSTAPIFPPTSGNFALLRFEPAGPSGVATVCFRIQDSGGAATVTNSWGDTAQGIDVGDVVHCVSIAVNGPPVAYFEPSTPTAAPGEGVTFDPCPRPVPLCTHDPDGAIISMLWEFGDGASSAMSAPRHVYAAPGQYLVRLTVFDNHGVRASHAQTVTVGWHDGGPVADDGPAGPGLLASAGDDRTVLEGSPVQLQGAQTGGDATTTFQWTQVSGPRVALEGAATATPRFTAPNLPTMTPVDVVLGLRVSQDAAASPSDYVVVHVVSGNHAPVAAAGGVVEVVAGSTATLDGLATADVDGDNLTYRWEQVFSDGDAAVQLSDLGAATPTFEAPTRLGSLHFRLTVSDGKASSVDLATVLVVPPIPPQGESRESPAVANSPAVAARVPQAADLTPLLVGVVAFALVGAGLAWAVARRHRRA